MKLKDTNQLDRELKPLPSPAFTSPNKSTLNENFNATPTLSEELDDLSIFNRSAPQLAENVYFQRLKEWMRKFHGELRDQTKCDSSVHKLLRDNHLRISLYENLVRLLREVAVTKDPDTQSEYVKRVHDWFVRREEKPQHVLWNTPIVKRPQNLLEKPLALLPSAELYRHNMRTTHTEISPPKSRLSLLDHKLLVHTAVTNKGRNESCELEDTSRATPNLSPMVGRALPRSVEKAERVGGRSSYLYYQPKDPKEQKVERLWFSRKNKLIASKRSTMEFYNSLKTWGHARARINEEIVRKHENITYSNNHGIRNYINKRLKQIKNSYSTNKRYKDLYDQESDDENSPKKVLSKSYDFKPPEIINLKEAREKPLKAPRRKKPPKKVLLDASKAINDSDKQRVNYIRRIYGKLINATVDNMDTADSIFVSGPKGMNTLSLYNKEVNRSYTDYNVQKLLGRKQPVTHTGARENFRVWQSKEVNKVKEFLTRKEVPCTMMSLQRAIVIPEDCPAKNMSPENFPKPGSRLFINPFAVKKKKGKKGKKRRR
eukprot:TRINITY_DN12965_c0_g3_i1.p1 TRINITY_DN12965_c0_g3~~TRINITY_DN12965_c0_g3_i1.p1  ORF type:complete len:544 (+),score=107.43 TRINITY_DN12965_c0_g3_i1:28-1659(+)